MADTASTWTQTYVPGVGYVPVPNNGSTTTKTGSGIDKYLGTINSAITNIFGFLTAKEQSKQYTNTGIGGYLPGNTGTNGNGTGMMGFSPITLLLLGGLAYLFLKK